MIHQNGRLYSIWWLLSIESQAGDECLGWVAWVAVLRGPMSALAWLGLNEVSSKDFDAEEMLRSGNTPILNVIADVIAMREVWDSEIIVSLESFNTDT